MNQETESSFREELKPTELPIDQLPERLGFRIPEEVRLEVVELRTKLVDILSFQGIIIKDGCFR